MQVSVETERTLARKAPTALPAYRQALRAVGLNIRRDPSLDDVLAGQGIIAHRTDAPILPAAREADVDYADFNLKLVPQAFRRAS